MMMNGCSVVDYFCLCDCLIERVNDLLVADRFESKHFPLAMKLKVPTVAAQ